MELALSVATEGRSERHSAAHRLRLEGELALHDDVYDPSLTRCDVSGQAGCSRRFASSRFRLQMASRFVAQLSHVLAQLAKYECQLTWSGLYVATVG